jgi:hypothetical protein
VTDTPRKDLKKKILVRIQREERRRLILKAVGFGTMLAGSISLVAFSYFELMAEATRSGLLSFVSLPFSDLSAVLANFSDFMLSVIESFPVFSMALLLCGVFFAVWSAARFANEVLRVREHRFSLLQ